MSAIRWDREAVLNVFQSTHAARRFVRIKTPHGMRTNLSRMFGRGLEGHCFSNSLRVARNFPDKFWYCEGYAFGQVPHAWLALKSIDGEATDYDWALDPTLPWNSKHWTKSPEKLSYIGIKVEVLSAVEFLTTRDKRLGLPKGATSISLLKYPTEISHLLTQIEGTNA